mmetsp:Transcript_16822/g.25127  ORF Transcript_16822/g.25127 Transcript_16822/m.25127 type:complete len:269 (+) Transcript_16822:27-833(+)
MLVKSFICCLFIIYVLSIVQGLPVHSPLRGHQSFIENIKPLQRRSFNSASPPLLDQWPFVFTSFWQQFITYDDEDRPPYAAGHPKEYDVYYGNTWYDWSGYRQFQTFTSGAFSGLGCAYSKNTTCAMLNIGSTAWSWMLEGEQNPAGPCCVEQNVAVLPPNFIDGLTKKPNSKILSPFPWDKQQEEASWNETPDGLFGYGYYTNVTLSDGIHAKPAGHYGHNFFGIPGWRWQTYLYFDLSSPDPSVFELPPFCEDAPPCKERSIPSNL